MGRRKKYITEAERILARKEYEKKWRESHLGPYGHQRGRPRKNKKIKKIRIPTYKALVTKYNWLTDEQRYYLSNSDNIHKIINRERRNRYSRDYQRDHKEQINKWRREIWSKTESAKQLRKRSDERNKIRREEHRLLHPELHLPKLGKAEDAIYDILVEKYGKDNVMRQKEINDGISLLFLDFYIPSLNMAIEYNGEQHYTPAKWWHWTKEDFENQVKRDERKRFYCNANGIRLIEIDGRKYGSEKVRRKKFKKTLTDIILGRALP